jgi:hypothetical protein
VEKPQRNSTGFCGGGQGRSWAVEPRKEEFNVEHKLIITTKKMVMLKCISLCVALFVSYVGNKVPMLNSTDVSSVM